MNELFEIDAEPRSDTGKGASRRLRHTGQVPGIIYGARKDPVMIALSHNELSQHLEHEAFYSHILSLKIGGKKQQVILKDLQRHPGKPFLMHVDFLRVSAKERLKTLVPLHFVGEEGCPGIKMGGASSHLVTYVEVSCLPKDLPEFIEVEMSSMEIGDAVMMSELVLPEGIELPAMAQGDEADMPVASVHAAHVVDEGEAEEGQDEAEGGEEAADTEEE